MIRNYLKIAFRNLAKYRFISFINLFGLTVGLTCCLLILTYILNELSYDKQFKKSDRIYRVSRSFNTPDGIETLHLSAVAPPFGPLLQTGFPDIEKMTRVYPNGTSAFKYGENIFNERADFFADSNFFDFFSVPVVKGNPKTALTDPFSVMLSEEMAKKYFGSEDPMNKVIRVDKQFNYKVTGVFKAFPPNTHFHPEILLSFNSLKDTAVYGEKQLQTNFGNNSFYTYLQLPENYPAEKMSAQFPSFLDKYVHFQGAPATYKPSTGTKLYLQKLTDIHLRSHLDDEAEENGDIKRVYIFSAIALFILLIACINYMNLSTARSVLRAKEIGVRKVVGAQRKEIIAQFLSESVLITWIALILAFGLTSLLLPYLSKLSGHLLDIKTILNGQVLVPILLLPFVVGLISGIYPALFMSSFKTIQVLKGVLKVGSGNISFRKVLVVTQFAISIVLIIATAVVFQQLRYMETTSQGYNKDHMVIIPYTPALNNQFESFRTELLRNSDIKNLSRSSRIPTGRLLDDMGLSIQTGDSLKPSNVDLKFLSVDYDFIPTYGIEMAAGRNFSRDHLTDSAAFIVNEVTMKALDWKDAQHAIGKQIQYGGVKGQIIGVTKDFHFESMHQPIIPVIMQIPALSRSYYGTLSVKISGNNIPSSLATIEQNWHKYLPETPFTSTFLDARFEKLYNAEEKQGSVFSIFACVAIFIACLGLFGLSAFAITQRIKEIGIRKVLGASTQSIVQLLSKDFLKLVIIAAVIAFPVAWYMMHNWLQDFAYRVNISWWLFLLAGIIAAIIALVTISFQAIKAAMTNPVKNLRTE